MKQIILYLSMSFMAGVLFVNVYNSIVDAVNRENNIHSSVEDLYNCCGTYLLINSIQQNFQNSIRCSD